MWKAGARVPYPVQIIGSELMMEFIGDPDGTAAPRLAAFDARKSAIVELHFFGGLSYEETAEAVGVSAATVDRDLRLAKAWLKVELGRGSRS